MSRRAPAVAFVGLVLVSSIASARTELPELDLAKLEAGVQERLREAADALARAVDDGSKSAEELGPLYGETGKIFNAHHVFAFAEACYREAGELEPGNLLWPYLLGFLYQDTGRLAAAKEQFERVLAIDPEHVLGRFRLARVHLDLAEIEPAKRLLEEVVEVPGVRAAAHTALGKLSEIDGAIEEAVRHYEAALSLQPRALQLHYPLTQAYRRLGDLSRAREHAAKARPVNVETADPILQEVGSLTSSSEMLLMTGARAVKGGRLDLAEEAFRKAVAANPDNSRAHINLAVALHQQGSLVEAEASAREALRLAPENFFAHFNLALVLEEQGRTEESFEHYAGALDADPRNVKANLRYANLLMRTGAYADAARRYRAVRERAPSLVQARYLEALAHISLDDFGVAVALLEEAVEIAPQHVAARNSLARLLATATPPDSEKALRALALAGVLNDEEVTMEHRETLAMALGAIGDYEAAIEIQLELLGASRRGADRAVTEHLAYTLALYRAGRPSNRPWRK